MKDFLYSDGNIAIFGLVNVSKLCKYIIIDFIDILPEDNKYIEHVDNICVFPKNFVIRVD